MLGRSVISAVRFVSWKGPIRTGAGSKYILSLSIPVTAS